MDSICKCISELKSKTQNSTDTSSKEGTQIQNLRQSGTKAELYPDAMTEAGVGEFPALKLNV